MVAEDRSRMRTPFRRNRLDSPLLQDGDRYCREEQNWQDAKEDSLRLHGPIYDPELSLDGVGVGDSRDGGLADLARDESATRTAIVDGLVGCRQRGLPWCCRGIRFHAPRGGGRP